MEYSNLTARLQQLDTACLCDAEKSLALGLRVVDPAIRPIPLGLKLVGRAHTVQCHNDFLAVIKGLRDAEPGDVLVIDSQGSDRAVSGELVPTEALRKGLAGIVNDGPCRDTAIVRTLGLHYYARSIHCRAGTTTHPGATQVTISCGGVPVDPGDIIVGDDDGLVIATADLFATLIPLSEQIQEKEDRLLQRMQEGQGLLELMNFDDHYQAVEEGRESSLEFLV